MKRAFTLIELLIVVAIIAILAAIAVPNFLEAQVRAKITRCKSDMRTIAVALEAYMVDWNKYPYDGYYGTASKFTPNPFDYWGLPYILTTPIAYSTVKDFSDPFRATNATAAARNLRYTNTSATYDGAAGGWAAYVDTPTNGTNFPPYESMWGMWRLMSSGPDRIVSNGAQTAYSPNVWSFVFRGTTYAPYDMNMPYDATNGTASYGDIIRTAKNPDGYGK